MSSLKPTNPRKKIGSDQWWQKSQDEATKQIDLARIAGEQAGTAQEQKIKKMKGRAFSRKTGPLGLMASPMLNRTSLLRG